MSPPLNVEGEGEKVIRNVGVYLPGYTTSLFRIQ